jgi:hypothetical protein
MPRHINLMGAISLAASLVAARELLATQSKAPPIPFSAKPENAACTENGTLAPGSKWNVTMYQVHSFTIIYTGRHEKNGHSWNVPSFDDFGKEDQKLITMVATGVVDQGNSVCREGIERAFKKTDRHRSMLLTNDAS